MRRSPHRRWEPWPGQGQRVGWVSSRLPLPLDLPSADAPRREPGVIQPLTTGRKGSTGAMVGQFRDASKAPRDAESARFPNLIGCEPGASGTTVAALIPYPWREPAPLAPRPLRWPGVRAVRGRAGFWTRSADTTKIDDV